MLQPTDLEFMYGTAWKEEETARLTYKALKAGFLAIDTANQRKHYYEEGVGAGLHSYLEESGRSRDSLFLQTKFTYERGQDHRLPYDPKASFSVQLQQSFASSLEHLRVDAIDSYLLHGPYLPDRLGEEDLETWSEMEALVRSDKIGCIGISNVSPIHLQELLRHCKIKPKFVQNRCFARFQWDQIIRDICESHDIIYQGFSLLTANQVELSQPVILEIAEKHSRTIPQILFKFARQQGMLALTGTTSQDHMKQDLDLAGFELSEEELGIILGIGL